MKKFLFASVLATLAAMAFASSASATISSPAPGGSVTGSGNVTFRGNILSTSCAIRVGATVATTTTANITSAAFTGCGSLATLTVLGLPGTPWRKSITLSPRNFTITGVQVRVQVPFVLDCLYSGSLSGTYTVGANSRLTITADALSLVRATTGDCSRDPTVTGSITTNATTV
ncbi:hypothetical protein VSS74_19240 [Conexibacter stalactiti]|uniref:Protein activator of alkane oxidation PraB n=1 Tax=Conexibacter stalactiti TaxID=1940611 RepID=A0ABU4HTB7_9ACTN|nr:hypothetical protein [Conexibacter stalactiti]MDW5596490.1 hypothetical protein [Conexibacter stalactiti]MEC5037132.1 hypothetical protein [Conexibacter stalactiti]